MAAVHLARLIGAVGFSRTVAIKRLHRHLANDEAFLSMFLDEARLAARIRHPNVVPTLDVVTVDQELFLVMEYVHGEALSKLARQAKAAHQPVPLAVASAVLVATLHGLHAAHEAKTESGEPLGIVHRDVSPQNILVGSDGVVRVLDFGIAKAMGRLHTTRDGEIKGKAAYMAPEQLRAGPVDARTDVYAASVVLWELLTGQRLFAGDSPEATMNNVLERAAPPPSTVNTGVSPALDELVLRGLSRDASKRFASAREMAIALEQVAPPATPHAVAEWVERTAGEVLRKRATIVADIESKRSLGEDSGALAPPSSRRLVDAPSSTATAVSTMATPSGRWRRSRPTAITYVAFAVAAVAIVVACWSVVTSRRVLPVVASTEAVAAPGLAAASASASASASAAASASASASGAPPSAESASLEAAPSATQAEARRPPSGARPAAAPVLRRPPARATAPASKKCDKPYIVEANGDHTPRPECL